MGIYPLPEVNRNGYFWGLISARLCAASHAPVDQPFFYLTLYWCMEGKKILIMVRGDVFSFGLQAHFREWGFGPVVIRRPDPAQVPALLREHGPVLLVTDLLTWPGGPASRELPAARPPVPTLLLVADGSISQAQYAALQALPSYGVLPKPCPVAHLKRGVESLLSVVIPAEPPSETVAPAWPADWQRV